MIGSRKLRELRELGFQTIKELETERGILASGRQEAYGCIFGRDSLITGIKLLRVYKKTGDDYLLTVVRKVLTNLVELQGKEINIESGEEPGKCIHEYRPDGHEHLTRLATPPWFVYGDGVMRNYDSVDATPLLLISLHEYYLLSRDENFLAQVRQAVELALDWILIYGDTNGDGLIDYRFHSERRGGGLVTQSWMDSRESLFHDDGREVKYPIAPIEVQAYAWSALSRWGREEEAQQLKRRFNEKFVIKKGRGLAFAFAVDGAGAPMTAGRSSIGHLLWAAYQGEAILSPEHISVLVKRLLRSDLFEPRAGVRTLSTSSDHFAPNSYHNGSIWPHDNSMIAEGLENFGYERQARRVRRALLRAYLHFRTPVELFMFDGEVKEYCSPSGHTACQKQAWSAAALLRETM